jgi:hypothetical protein
MEVGVKTNNSVWTNIIEVLFLKNSLKKGKIKKKNPSFSGRGRRDSL